MPVDLNKLEVDRIVNLITNFGWVKTSEAVTDDRIVMTISKPRVSPPPETGEGAD